MKKFPEMICIASGGYISAEMEDDNGNNSAFRIIMEGGQFHEISLGIKKKDARVLEIIGAFETREFLEFCHRVYLKAYVNDGYWLQEHK